MIHEIIGFIEYLEKNDISNNSNLFSEGMYIFLEEDDDDNFTLSDLQSESI